MKDFYFIRHGETDANKEGLVAGGGWDIALNETGKSQARELAKRLEEEKIKATKIIASTMTRAKQTATILNTALLLPMELDAGFEEWHVGEWERLPWDQAPNPFTTEQSPEGGETKREFQQRVMDSLNLALENIGDDECPLIVAHGAVGHVLFQGLGLEVEPIKNCQLYFYSNRELTRIS